MAEYATLLNPSLTDAEGHSKFLNRLFSSGVALAFNSNGFKVTQRGAGANMSVDVAAGDGLFGLPSTAFGYWGWADATKNVVVTAANPTNPRIDTVVAWIDPTITTTGSANSPGALKFSVMDGTPAGSPVAMNDATIQSTLGAGIAWIKLATFTVGAAVTSIVNANISDQRASIIARSFAPNVVDGAITNAKFSTVAGQPGAASQSWVPTWTNLSIGNGTVAARYSQVGKTIDYRLTIVFGSTTSVTGLIGFSLPASTATYSGTAYIATREVQFLDFSAGVRTYGLCLIGSTTRLDVFVESVGGSYTGIASTASGTPYTWGTGDEIHVSGSYEAA